MRAFRPRRLVHVAAFAAAAESPDFNETFAKSSACSFMTIVCDFSVSWICGALVHFTSEIVPTIE